MLSRLARRVREDRLLLLAIIIGSVILFLSLLGLLYIQVLMVAWSILMFLLIIRIENKKLDLEISVRSDHARWQKLREELKKVEQEINTTTDNAKTKELIARKRDIERRIRESQWNLKEEELSSIFKANIGRLPRSKTNDPQRLEKMIRKRLDQIDRECKEIAKEESQYSKSLLLARISNELKAMFWMVREENGMLSVASDIWVTWCILEAAMKLEKVQPKVLTYATNKYRQKADLLASVLHVNLENE